VRQELSAPAIAIMGYAEILMDDATQAGGGQLTDDLQRILDASRNLHRLILGLLGVILGGAGISSGRKKGAGTGLAIAGLVLGLISLVPSILIIAFVSSLNG